MTNNVNYADYQVCVVGSLKPQVAKLPEELKSLTGDSGLSSLGGEYWRILLRRKVDLTPGPDGIIRVTGLDSGAERARVEFLGRNSTQFNIISQVVGRLAGKENSPDGYWSSPSGEKLPYWELPLIFRGAWVSRPVIYNGKPVQYHILGPDGSPRKVVRRGPGGYTLDTARASTVTFFAYDGEDVEAKYQQMVQRLRPGIESWLKEASQADITTVDVVPSADDE